jgi:hypothetical protein
MHAVPQVSELLAVETTVLDHSTLESIKFPGSLVSRLSAIVCIKKAQKKP